MIELAALALSFIVASGFLAMIDAAILNVTPAEVEVLLQKKRWGAAELKRLLRHTTRAIIVIVIFTNVINILGPILVGRKAEALFGSSVIGIVTALLTFFTIIFSEIIPKSIGAHHAPRISRRAAPFLLWVTIILFPIVTVLERIVRIFKQGKRSIGTEEQIRALANIGGGAGHIDADERELIHRAFVLNDKKASDIMVPAAQMVFAQKSMNVTQAARLVFRHHYSRYPVVGASLDDVLGYILSIDILRTLAEGTGGESILGLVREAVSVDADMRCDELLQLLRSSSPQFAIVTRGEKTAGIVTLEDVLSELVGEIEDEAAEEKEQYN